MRKFSYGDGQYIVYAKDKSEAKKIVQIELNRFEKIKEKMFNLLAPGGEGCENFKENISEERLNIHFLDEESLISEDPLARGAVRQRENNTNNFYYELEYKYPVIGGQNADYRLAHEIGHLVLNPSNVFKQVRDDETKSTKISGLIRMGEDRKLYGLEIQENAINLLAELALKGKHSADDIMASKVDLTEFNFYKQCDKLIKLLAVSMRNDYIEEMSFDELVENKIDSYIEKSDGTREPANTFFHGLINDSSVIEKEIDKYFGEGTYRDIDLSFTELHKTDIDKDRFNNIFGNLEALLVDFARARMQDKYKETIEKEGVVPDLENKIQLINEVIGRRDLEVEDVIGKQEKNAREEEPNIQEEIVTIEKNKIFETQPTTYKQKLALILKENDWLNTFPFVEKFINSQLNLLSEPGLEQKSEPEQESGQALEQVKNKTESRSRREFMDRITNFGEYRNLLKATAMADRKKMNRIVEELEQKQADKKER